MTEYDVLRDGVRVGSVSGSTLAYLDSGLTPGTTYKYAVVAKDAAGHASDTHSVSVKAASVSTSANGTAAGTVVDASTGKVLSGVKVTTFVGTTTKSATTNNRGKYSLGNLPPGDYTLTLSVSSGKSTTIAETVTAGEVSLVLTAF